MDPALLDNPLILSILFYPQPAEPGSGEPGVLDGTIPVADDVVLGYRLYRPPRQTEQTEKLVILYFHGNGEVASDYDNIAPFYHRAGASLLVVDYRGYGWSTGRPLVSTLLTDTEVVVRILPDVLRQTTGKADLPCLVMGRSLGSACAIHAAHTFPDAFRGLIIESGFAHTIPLLARLGLPVETLANVPDPIGNAHKIASIGLPLLVIHGERDNLIPVSNGQTLYDASPASLRRLARIPRAGHNDLLFVGMDEYFDAIDAFIEEVLK